VSAVGGNKIKHHASKIKGDIKLCASSFSVVILPGSFSHLVKVIIPTLKRMDETYLDRLCLSENAIFCVCVTVNKNNCWVGGSENPPHFTEHECDSSKVNVWCDLMRNEAIDPFFSGEPVMTGDTLPVRMVHVLTFPITFVPFWTGSFLIVGKEEGPCLIVYACVCMHAHASDSFHL
jgi:hypothetical protein